MYDDYHGIHVGHSKAFSLLMSISTFLFILFASIAIGTRFNHCRIFVAARNWRRMRDHTLDYQILIFYISACALYYLAELAEEYASVSKQIVKYALYVRACVVEFIKFLAFAPYFALPPCCPLPPRSHRATLPCVILRSPVCFGGACYSDDIRRRASVPQSFCRARVH